MSQLRNDARRVRRTIQRFRAAYNRIRPAHQHLTTKPKRIRKELALIPDPERLYTASIGTRRDRHLRRQQKRRAA